MATDEIDDNLGSARADVVDDSSAADGSHLLCGEADTSVFHDLFGTKHDASLRMLVQMRHDSQLA